MRKSILIITGAVIALLITLVAIGASQQPASPAHKHTAAVVAPSPTPPPAPVPSPAGTATGSCNYTLGSNPAGGTAAATAEVDLDNTGNIGDTVKVTVSWPQEGYAPLTETKTVQLPWGATGQPVEFSLPLTFDQISNLQNWETGHNFPADDCTYGETITGTYGQAHS